MEDMRTENFHVNIPLSARADMTEVTRVRESVRSEVISDARKQEVSRYYAHDCASIAEVTRLKGLRRGGGSLAGGRLLTKNFAGT
jgi:hypothetical protein